MSRRAPGPLKGDGRDIEQVMKSSIGNTAEHGGDIPNTPTQPSFARTQFSDQQRIHALKIVAQCDGNLTIAAQRLGISIPTLSRWRKKSSV